MANHRTMLLQYSALALSLSCTLFFHLIPSAQGVTPYLPVSLKDIPPDKSRDLMQFQKFRGEVPKTMGKSNDGKAADSFTVTEISAPFISSTIPPPHSSSPSPILSSPPKSSPPPPPKNEPPYIFVEEIFRPVTPPRKSRTCSIIPLVTNQPFGNITTPIFVDYVPPSACTKGFKQIKLSVAGNGIGFQNSRFLEIFFDELIVLRLATPNGINRTAFYFDADLTKYAAYLATSHKVKVTLQSSINSEDYYVSASLTFRGGLVPSRFADVIIPIAANDPEKGYLPFSLTNSSNSYIQALSTFPRNAYRAEIEIITTPNGPDELLAFSLPREFGSQFPFIRSDGFFREVQISIDEILAGVVWPKTVLYPSFLISSYWENLVGIGSFSVPTYFVDITPFVGNLVKEGNHNFGFEIPEISAGSFWKTNAVLHIWLDKNSKQTSGSLVSAQIAPAVSPSTFLSVSSDKSTIDVTVNVSRSSYVEGIVVTSMGNFSSRVSTQQRLVNAFKARGKTEVFNVDSNVYTQWSATINLIGAPRRKSLWYSKQQVQRYPMKILSEGLDVADGRYSQVFENRQNLYIKGKPYMSERTWNHQKGFGFEIALANAAGATTSQQFSYVSDYNGCYSRMYDASVLALLTDVENFTCSGA